MNEQKKYKPVNCSFMDEVEHLATQRKRGGLGKGQVVYLSNDVEVTIEDAILTWQTRSGVEYLVLESGLEIRMDAVVSLYGVRASGADD